MDDIILIVTGVKQLLMVGEMIKDYETVAKVNINRKRSAGLQLSN